MFRNKTLVVIGGGDSACEEASFLTKFAYTVIMLVRGSQLRASAVLRSRVARNPKIQIRYSTSITGVIGSISPSPKLSGLKIGLEILPVQGLFYAIGHQPNTGFLHQALELSPTGYIQTINTRTNIPGVFACGDVQDPIYRQAITAAGSGCTAALEAEKYLCHES